MIKMKYGKRRKSKRLAKKGTTHYEEPVISDDDDYICECSTHSSDTTIITVYVGLWAHTLSGQVVPNFRIA